MMYILDTNICIHMLNQRSLRLLKNVKNREHAGIYISDVSVSELWYGVFKSKRYEENSENLESFLSLFNTLPFDSTYAKLYGELRLMQEKSGKNIGFYDLQIISQALALDAVLVSANEKELSQVKGLKVENWLRAKP